MEKFFLIFIFVVLFLIGLYSTIWSVKMFLRTIKQDYKQAATLKALGDFFALPKLLMYFVLIYLIFASGSLLNQDKFSIYIRQVLLLFICVSSFLSIWFYKTNNSFKTHKNMVLLRHIFINKYIINVIIVCIAPLMFTYSLITK